MVCVALRDHTENMRAFLHFTSKEIIASEVYHLFKNIHMVKSCNSVVIIAICMLTLCNSFSGSYEILFKFKNTSSTWYKRTNCGANIHTTLYFLLSFIYCTIYLIEMWINSFISKWNDVTSDTLKRTLYSVFRSHYSTKNSFEKFIKKMF